MDKRAFEPGFAERRKIIGVIGGKKDFPELTIPLGQLIASRGFHLLTGAGTGIMEGVSRAFVETPDRLGLSIGIVRATAACASPEDSSSRPFSANPVNAWIEVPIYTHLHLSSQSCASRNHINVLTSDLIIALPGSSGTRSEVELSIQYERPLIFFTGGETIDGCAPHEWIAEYKNAALVSCAGIDEVDTYLGSFLEAAV
jgi:predicted Rossmann-fold nucleotide-binding protein